MLDWKIIADLRQQYITYHIHPKCWWNTGKCFSRSLYVFHISLPEISLRDLVPFVRFKELEKHLDVLYFSQYYWMVFVFQKCILIALPTAQKVSVFGGILVRVFPYSIRMRENADPKTPNTDTFYTLIFNQIVEKLSSKH